MNFKLELFKFIIIEMIAIKWLPVDVRVGWCARGQAGRREGSHTGRIPPQFDDQHSSQSFLKFNKKLISFLFFFLFFYFFF